MFEVGEKQLDLPDLCGESGVILPSPMHIAGDELEETPPACLVLKISPRKTRENLLFSNKNSIYHREACATTILSLA